MADLSTLPQDNRMQQYLAMLQAGLPQQQQPEDDSAGPTTEGFQNLGGASANTPRLLSQDDIQNVLKRGTETVEGNAAKLLREQYWGLKEGETASKGKKAKNKIFEILRALTENHYQTPTERYRAIAEKQFPEETQRLGVLGPIERMQTQMDSLNANLGMKQKQLDALITDRNTRNDLAKTKEKDQASARDLRNTILGKNVDSLSGLRTKEGQLADSRKALADFKTAHPNINEGTLFGMLMGAGSNDDEDLTDEDKKNLLNTWLSLKVASNPLAKAGSTSESYVQDGTTKRTTVPNFINGGILRRMGMGGLIPPLAPNNAAPAAPDANTPAATPAVTPPVASPLPNAVQTPPAARPSPEDLLDPRIELPPGTRMTTGDAAKRSTATVAMNKAAHNIQGFEMQTGGGLSNIVNAILSGRSKDFQGPMQGNPTMIMLRNLFGSKTNEEVIQTLNNLDALYAKLGSNVRGRFTLPEISGHLATMGNLAQNPENSVSAIAALKLHANAQRLFETGKLKPEDAQAVSTVIRQEMDRLRGAVKGATPQDKARALVNGPPGKQFQVGELSDLLQQYRKQTGPKPTADQIRQELLNRAAKKK